MSREAFSDTGITDIRDVDPDEMTPYHMMSPEQKAEGWAPLTGSHKSAAEHHSFELTNGDSMGAVDYLNAIALNPVDDPLMPGAGLQKPPDDGALQRAWFALYHNMGHDEVISRLQGN